MSTNDFDRLIVKNVSRVAYEYDAGDWENLTLQLTNARRKKSFVVLAYLSSGIAACVAIFLIGIVLTHTKKEIHAMQYASRPHAAPPVPLSLSLSSGVHMLLPGAKHITHYNSSPVISHKKHVRPVLDTVTYNTPIVYNNLPANISAPPVKILLDTSGSGQNSIQHGNEEPISLLYIAKENIPDHKRINISVTSGVNFGKINTGYAIGAAADKKLSNKFGVEATVAYLGNTASMSASQYPFQFPPVKGGGYIPPTKPSPVPVITSHSPLNYLQFAPMADYSLFKKITLSAGADLQRLLQEHDVTVLYNDNTRVVPLIDLGILLRTECSIFPALKAGLSYRFGANNLVSPGNNYFDRNYMQIQLKYKLR